MFSRLLIPWQRCPCHRSRSKLGLRRTIAWRPPEQTNYGRANWKFETDKDKFKKLNAWTVPSSMLSTCWRPSGLFYEEGELLENNKGSFPIQESFQVQQSRKCSATDQKKSGKRLLSEASLDQMVRGADGTRQWGRNIQELPLRWRHLFPQPLGPVLIPGRGREVTWIKLHRQDFFNQRLCQNASNSLCNYFFSLCLRFYLRLLFDEIYRQSKSRF